MNIIYITWLRTIPKIQTTLLGFGIGILLILPLILVFAPQLIPGSKIPILYNISLYSVTFVMVVRPLADIFYNTKWVRSFVILRKGFGVLSASVIVAFIFSKIIVGPAEYFSAFLTPEYWSLSKYALLAHLSDISAVILLITSNIYSKRVLSKWWKRIQRSSYIYFYGGIGYEAFVFGYQSAYAALAIVTILTTLAYLINHNKQK